MRNVTITLEDDVARWARIKAAENDTSVSRLVGEMLRDKMIADEGYRAALEAFFGVAPRALRSGSNTLPPREDLHDRASLR